MDAITLRNGNGELAHNGQAANDRARLTVFADYRSRKAQNTLSTQDNALRRFADFLEVDADLSNDPAAWQGITWGIVDGFVKQMVLDGFSLATVNNTLAHVKTYAKLAARAGFVDTQELALLKTVSGYGHKEGKRVDEKRAAANIPTRQSHKKADFNTLTDAQCSALRGLVDATTPQGRRDAVLIVLLLDLGLRVSEAALLRAGAFDPATGTLTVYRPKTDTTTTFTLKNGKLAAMRAYFENDAPTAALLQGSRKSGRLTGAMSERAIQARVSTWGATLGIDNLSPHDLRHTRATQLAPTMHIKQLMDFFGWNSPAMAARYIESQNAITVE